MSNQLIITSGAKVRNLNGVLTGTAGVVDSVPLGGANGVATLDSSGKVPVSQLPASVVTYLGTWNAATNTPTLTNGVGDAGDMYLCNVAGTVDFGAGPISFNIGDWVLYGSGTWQKSNGQNGTVTSVDMTVPTGLAISGNPITTSGTLALSLASGYTIPTTSFLSGLVPYTGATGNVDLGTYGIKADYSQFNLTPSSVPTTVGTLSWDSEYRTLQLIDGDGDTTLQIGQEQRALIHNGTGSTLTDGQVVYVTGSTGQLPSVALASNALESTSSVTFGVVTETIPNGEDGFVTISGMVNGLNTLAFNEGDAIYLGATAGTFTNVKPTAPANLVLIGYVIKKAGGNGSIFVKIQNGYELEELHDVLITSVANNEGIFWDSATSLWKNKTIAGALGYTPADDSLVVKLAGTQTITGSKTFDGYGIFNLSQLLKFNPTFPTTPAAGYLGVRAEQSGVINSLNLWDGTTYNTAKLSFDNTSSYTYTFPSLSGTLALLEGTQTFSGQKTFSTNPIITSLASANIEINSATGSTSSVGFKVNNSLVGFVSVNSSQFLFRNYVSNEFRFVDGLMTNGGILSMPSASLQTYTFPAASGTIALTSNLSSYLPLSGGTLTGLLQSTNSINVSSGQYIGVAVGSSTGFAISSLGLTYYNSTFNLSVLSSTLTSNKTITFPDASGTIALTSNIPTVSGASGQVTYFNGTSSVTGSNNFFWDATNNRLGIGLTNPQRSLEVYSATADSHLRLSGSAPSVSMGEAITGSIYQAKFGLATANGQYASGAVAGDFVILSQTGATIFMTNATEKMRVNTSGRLLLGTTTDNGSLLQVAGSGTFSGNIISNRIQVTGSTAPSGGSGLEVFWDGSYAGILGYNRTGGSYLPVAIDGSTVTLFTSSTPRLTIASTGAATFSSSVTSGGLNTIAYANSASSMGMFIVNTANSVTNNSSDIWFGNWGGASISSIYNARISALNTDTSSARTDLLFFTYGGTGVGSVLERMRITSGGNVSIGYSNAIAGAPLGVLSSLASQQAISIWNTATSGTRYFMEFSAGASYTAVGSITYNGTLTAYNVTSDYRLKQDFKDYNALSILNNIKTYDFEWKTDKSRMYGVIAHELQEILPYAVVGEKDGEKLQGVDYSKLVPVLVKAIQEQQAQIEELKQLINNK